MTDFLYARPSVLEGIGRNVDLFGVLNKYNVSDSGLEADLKARDNDVEVLREDYQTAYGMVMDGNRR
jgi:hypothetical protein